MRNRSELFNELYPKLRRLAQGKLGGEHGVNGPADATSLVHEVYLKLRSWSEGFLDDRHFLATASAAMRQIIVDRARARKALKRGVRVQPLSVSLEGPLEKSPSVLDVLLFDEMLNRLGTFDKRAAQIVEMRVFLGLSETEIADDLGISSRTVKRDWSAAIAWLKIELRSGSSPGG
jgi:RNA polymerase sigma factor (TIGR02999 family)